MATLSEDSDSWRARGVIRRDFRHDFGVSDEPRRPRGKKDTRRWCKGKVGLPHIFARQFTTGLPFDWLHSLDAPDAFYQRFRWSASGYISTKCGRCGKQFYSWGRNKRR